ncbi:MAG: hypothetical protein H6679_02570 [Epsilonproteobacteria bacterium]|nr:hypothetical protein [Campylobacterota bacterium]
MMGVSARKLILSLFVFSFVCLCTSVADWCFNPDTAYFLISSDFEQVKPLNMTSYEHVALSDSKVLKQEPVYAHDIVRVSKKVRINVEYCDNGKDKILIIGPGYNNKKEHMQVYAQKFNPEYDILLFDYRWAKLKKYYMKLSTIFHPLNKLVYHPVQEVEAVVNYAKSKKEYQQVIGLGKCYSATAFIMAEQKAQEAGGRLFDKLILDSTWLSLRGFMKSIYKKSSIFATPFLGFASLFVPKVGVERHIPYIQGVPTLFIHGSGDSLVPLDHFKRIWQSAVNLSQKAVLVTPHEHVEHLSNTPFYKNVIDQFINYEFSDFVEKITLA